MKRFMKWVVISLGLFLLPFSLVGLALSVGLVVPAPTGSVRKAEQPTNVGLVAPGQPESGSIQSFKRGRRQLRSLGACIQDLMAEGGPGAAENAASYYEAIQTVYLPAVHSTDYLMSEKTAYRLDSICESNIAWSEAQYELVVKDVKETKRIMGLSLGE